MKRAFTLVELVLVVIVIGILSAIVAPSFSTSNKVKLSQLGNQIVKDIRYTQHLAMMSEKFNPNDRNWFKSRWFITFNNQRMTTGSQEWRYTIFSDWTGNHTGTPSFKEIAKSPYDPKKYLTGGNSSLNVPNNDYRLTQEMNLGKTYGITRVTVTGGCNGNSISFDYLGRPYCLSLPGNQSDGHFGAPFDNNKIIHNKTFITFYQTSANNKNYVQVSIEPETGYTKLEKVID